MKIVNVNDVEDLILAKHEIDQLRIKNNEITEKSILNEFVNTYVFPKYVYVINGKQIAFNYIKVYDSDYLFVNEICDENELLVNKIKQLKYDMSNLTQLSDNDMINIAVTNYNSSEPNNNPINNVIIYNGHYYN